MRRKYQDGLENRNLKIFVAMKLKEGKRYDFLIEKELTVGNNDYYLLRGPAGGKYLLPQKHYSDYGIELKSSLNCRVDRINCRGEVFLEPANPFYEEGKEYDFKISGRDIRVNDKGELTPVLVLEAKYGNELIIPLNEAGLNDTGKEDYIRLPVKRINKGRLILTCGSEKPEGERVEEGRIYEFFIYDKKKGLDGREYYLIRDTDNLHHILPVSYYSYYGLGTGKSFRGRFIKYQDGGKYKIEPLNPYYKPGEVYEFELVSVSSKADGQGKILVLTDNHGLKHEVHVPEGYEAVKKLHFRVEKIRKGWPLLVPCRSESR